MSEIPLASAGTGAAGDTVEPVTEVAVIGAGWAGLSAAVRLVEHGIRPLLIDAAPQVGGRARAIDLDLAGQTCRLDNGQHLLVGAYRDTLALIEKVGGAHTAIVRQPMRLESVDGLLIEPLRLPAPLDLLGGLLCARGLSWAQRWALLRCLAGQRFNGWRVPHDQTVAVWLRLNRQPASLIERFWEPMCVATLNTPIEAACARTFVCVLRDTLGQDAAACEFVLPRQTLDEVLPLPAQAWLARHQVLPLLRHPLRSIRPASGKRAGWILAGPGGSHHHARQIILAVPPINALRLLQAGTPVDGMEGEPGNRQSIEAIHLGDFDYEPIATVYLAWRQADVVLKPWLMLTEEPGRQAYGQWLFDRGTQHGLRVGAVVVSARGRTWLAAGNDAGHDLGVNARSRPTRTIAEQVSRQLGLPMPIDARVVVDKRATFRCTPARPQPVNDALQERLPGLWLAGDYMWPAYPATLEAAVRSGRQAAESCLRKGGAG